MSLRTRFLVLAVLLLMVSSCLATNRKILMVDGKGKEKRQLAENETGKFEKPGSSVNNHHNIPRQDFNNYNGGTPKGGGNGDNDGQV